jgi:hypothetical protein
MALLSAVFGWFAVNSQARDREQQAIRSIQSMCGSGCIAVLNRDDDDDWLCGTGLAGVAEMKWRGPGWLRQPLEFFNAPILYRIITLDLADTQVGDSIIEPLAKLTCLTQINVSRTQITDEGIQRINEMFPRAQVVYEPAAENSTKSAASEHVFN